MLKHELLKYFLIIMQKNNGMLLFERLFALDYYEVIADEAFGVTLRGK